MLKILVYGIVPGFCKSGHNLPIMLKIILKNKNCASSIITICIQICINKTTYSRHFRKTVLLGCIYKWQQNALYDLLRQ